MGALRNLLASPAQAEIVPQDQAAVDLILASIPAYNNVLQAAHDDPRRVNVWAGKNAEWLDRTNAAAMFVPRPAKADVEGPVTTMPNSVFIGPSLDPETPMERDALTFLNLYPRQLPGFDPQTHQQTTLAHELGHFLASGRERLPGDREFLADLVAANPSYGQLLDLATRTSIYGTPLTFPLSEGIVKRVTRAAQDTPPADMEAVRSIAGGDPYGLGETVQRWSDYLQSVLGQQALTFVGPPQPGRPLVFNDVRKPVATQAKKKSAAGKR